MSGEDDSARVSDPGGPVSDSAGEEGELENAAACNPYSQSSETKAQKQKRLMTYFSNRYSQLLVEKPEGAGLEGEKGLIHIGAVTWTAAERQQFFKALSVKSQSNVRAVTESIRTKSETEVYDYLCLLKDEVVKLQSRSDYNSQITQADIPASFEISFNFDAVLEQFADGSVAWQDRREANAGRRKHAGSWLVDSVEARSLDASLKGLDEQSWEVLSGDDHVLIRQPAIPAHGIFHFSTWVRLAEGLFMNSGSTGDPYHWTTHAASDESPSITLDAFEDFHQIVVSYLRNLMQTAIYCASSRLKAMEATSYTPEKLLNAEDVDVAISLLGLPRDRSDFWTTLARRTQLQVVDHPKGVAPENATPPSLEEAEYALVDESVSSSTTSSSVDPSVSSDENQTSSHLALLLRTVGPGSGQSNNLSRHTENSENSEDDRSDTEDSSDADDPMSEDQSGSENDENGAETNSGKSIAMSSNESSSNDSESSSGIEQDRIVEAYDHTVSHQHELELQNLLGVPSLPPMDPPESNSQETASLVNDHGAVRANTDSSQWRDTIAELRQDWEARWAAEKDRKRKRDETDEADDVN